MQTEQPYPQRMNLNSQVGRAVEPVLLGVTANIAVNIIFNPYSFTFPFKEFISAIILCVPITELSRYIDRRLEEKISWREHPIKRFAIHFLLILVCLIVLLNSLGNAWLYIMQDGFFSWKELLIINLVTLCLAILLTVMKWTVQFYLRWVHAENNVSASAHIIDELKKKLVQPTGQIDIQKGNSKIKMEAQTVRLVKIAFGTVRIYSEAGLCGTFPGSLSQLNALLPEHVFFQVSRDAILHKKVIGSITSGSFGKVLVKLHEQYDGGYSFTVSRIKAAAFRKWYNSSSM